MTKSRRQDADVKKMSLGKARQAIMRIRRALRKHRDAHGNARCWHNDVQLYARALPEAKPAGKMTGSKKVLLRNCSRYIDRQKCTGAQCSRSNLCKRKTAHFK